MAPPSKRFDNVHGDGGQDEPERDGNERLRLEIYICRTCGFFMFSLQTLASNASETTTKTLGACIRGTAKRHNCGNNANVNPCLTPFRFPESLARASFTRMQRWAPFLHTDLTSNRVTCQPIHHHHGMLEGRATSEMLFLPQKRRQKRRNKKKLQARGPV